MPRSTVKSKPSAKTHQVRQKKQKLLSDFRTSAILEASRRVFAKKGFDAALVDDIAAEAGIAKGTVYLYFKSKADIYNAALQEDMAALALLKTQRVAAAATAYEKLRAYIAVAVEYCERRRDFFRIFLVESGKLACPARHSPKQQRELAAGQVTVLLDLLRSAAASGEIHCPDPDFTAWTVGYTIRALIERRLLTPSAATSTHDINTLLHFLWKGLAPHPKTHHPKPPPLPKLTPKPRLPRREPLIPTRSSASALHAPHLQPPPLPRPKRPRLSFRKRPPAAIKHAPTINDQNEYRQAKRFAIIPSQSRARRPRAYSKSPPPSPPHAVFAYRPLRQHDKNVAGSSPAAIDGMAEDGHSIGARYATAAPFHHPAASVPTAFFASPAAFVADVVPSTTAPSGMASRKTPSGIG